MNLKPVSLGALAISTALVSVLPAQNERRDASQVPSLDIVETAAEAGSFKTLLAAAQAAGLVETLEGKGPLTVFAPTDAAFARLPEGTIEALLADKEQLAAILTYHVLSGEVLAAKLVKMQWAETVQGQSFRVNVSEDGVMVDDAKVIKADIRAKNGIIHVIDSVILPRPDIVTTAVEAGSFKTLAAALKAAGMIEALQGKGPFTVFAPTDEAFAMLPEGTVEALLKDIPSLQAILKYHVVPGRYDSDDLPASANPKTLQGSTVNVRRSKDGKVTVEGANVISADIFAGNGVIHVIDRVILPN